MNNNKITKKIEYLIFVLFFCVITSCSKYDDTLVRQDIDDLKQRLSTLEEATSALKARLDSGYLIKSVTAIEESPGGWHIEFTGGTPSSIDIMSVTSGAADINTPTLQIEVRTGSGGTATLWYDTGDGWTDTGVNLAGLQGDQGIPGISPIVRVDDRGDNLVVIQYNITEGYPDDKWEDAGNPIALDSNPRDKEAIYLIAQNQETGTITITMNDSDVPEERTTFEFAMASGAARIELVGFSEKVLITETATAEIRFRVNPSNAFVPLTLDKWQLDQTGTRETRASYVTEPTDFELVSIAKDGDKEGQYVATIKCLAYNPAIAEYAMALVLNTGTPEEPALVSSPTFVLGAVAVPVTGVSLNESSIVLFVGESETLSATVALAGAANKAVSWSVTEGEDVATVDQNGEVTAVKNGVATITVTTVDGGETAACTVTVIDRSPISAGTFTMGSPESELGHFSVETQHEVTLTEDFYMGKYEITNTQYVVFLNAVGVPGVGGGYVKWDVAGFGEQNIFVVDMWGQSPQWSDAESRWVSDMDDDTPMVWVTWYGAKAYADWVGGALPTEAQWEYACRAGSTTAYSYGDAANGDYMWYRDNANDGAKVVGQKQPNDWDLYDMHGNVAEWCSDWYGTYDTAPATDPAGPASGTARVRRGGSLDVIPAHCRSAARVGIAPFICSNTDGFRVAFPIQ